MSSTTNDIYSEENIDKYIKIVKEEVWVMAIVRRLLHESLPIIIFLVYPDLSIFNPRLLKFIFRDQNYKYIRNEELLEQYHLGYKEFYDLFGDLSVSSMKTLNSIQSVIKDIIASEMCSDKIEFSLEDLKTSFYNNGYLCACANYEEENGILIEVWDKSNSNRKIGNRIMSLSNVEAKKEIVELSAPERLLLLWELGFNDLPMVKNLDDKQYKKMMTTILKFNKRDIEGYINSQNASSEEAKYMITDKHKHKVNKYLLHL